MKQTEDRKRWSGLIAILAGLVLAIGCVGETPDSGDGDGDGDVWEDKLNDREADFSEALRTAALQLTGDLPSYAEIVAVADAPSEQEARTQYTNIVNSYFERASYNREMFEFFEHWFKMGDSDVLHSVPALATDIMVNDRSMMDLLVQQTGNCPTVAFDADGIPTVTPADCLSGAPVQSGILTNEQFQSQFYSNLAFKRVRVLQEFFDCLAFPGRLSEEPVEIASGKFFEGRFAFEDITGNQNRPEAELLVDFQDTSAVVCANCHANGLNHRAPLFMNFDADGIYQPQSSVLVPVEGEPAATLRDYLVDGVSTAYLPGQPVSTIGEFGAAMAADPNVAECMVARAWNFRMSKSGDIVDGVASVPSEVIAPFVQIFIDSNYNWNTLMRTLYDPESNPDGVLY